MSVLCVEWDHDEPPSRAYFQEAIAQAYASIELPFFPSGAWVTVVTADASARIEAGEPQDEAMVAAASGYG